MFKSGVDINALLAGAPQAVDSFYSGHWKLLSSLEERASRIVGGRDFAEMVSFLVDVAFMKQPYQMDEFRRNQIRDRILDHKEDLACALDALSNIHVRDYAVMGELAKIPYFGINGGRAFNSAVMRLVCPDRFGIIDWRNLAVMAAANGFEGLIEPPVVFARFDKQTIVREKGHLLCSQDVYERYNNIMRELAADSGIRTADVDLILWTYSIHRKPFRVYQQDDSIFRQIFSKLLRMDSKTRLKDKNISELIATLTQSYIAVFKELGWLPADKIRRELRALFSVIRDECEAYGRNKPRMRSKIKKITLALETGIKARSGESLLSHWRRWENMLNPASPTYIGIDLPGSMIMEGYLVFEQLVPIRNYFEQRYRDSSFEPIEPYESVLGN